MSTSKTMFFGTLIVLSLLTPHVMGYGDPCENNADCDPYWEYCDSKVTHECEHKFAFPMLSIEFVGCFFAIFIVMIANSGGLGGGGVIIPVGIAFFNFDTRESIALSNVSVFISSVVRFFVVINK